jgi:hypothetical protein
MALCGKLEHVKGETHKRTNAAEWFPSHTSMNSESGNVHPPPPTQYEYQERNHNLKYTNPKIKNPALQT